MLRIKSALDFERVRREGRYHAHPLVVLVTCPQCATAGEPSTIRCGFVAGKQLGRAVARNRAKRLLREAVRRVAPAITAGWDLVWIARAPLAAASLSQTLAAVEDLVRRARLLRE